MKSKELAISMNLGLTENSGSWISWEPSELPSREDTESSCSSTPLSALRLHKLVIVEQDNLNA